MFHVKFYSYLYPQLKEKGIKSNKELKKHWDEIGKKQGYIGYHPDKKNFNWKYYIDHNNLKMIVFDEKDAIKHWYNIGKNSGLKCYDKTRINQNNSVNSQIVYNSDSDDSLNELEIDIDDKLEGLISDSPKLNKTYDLKLDIKNEETENIVKEENETVVNCVSINTVNEAVVIEENENIVKEETENIVKEENETIVNCVSINIVNEENEVVENGVSINTVNEAVVKEETDNIVKEETDNIVNEDQLNELNYKLKQEIMEKEHKKIHKAHTLCIKKKEHEKLESQLESINQILDTKKSEIKTFDLKIVFTKISLSMLSLKYNDVLVTHNKKKEEIINESDIFIKMETGYNNIKEKLFLEKEINRQKNINYEKQLSEIVVIENKIEDEKNKNILVDEKCNSLKVQIDNLEKTLKNNKDKNHDLNQETLKLQELLTSNNEKTFKLNEENKNIKTINKNKNEELKEIEKIIKEREKENIKFLKESDDYICKIEKSQEELLELTNLKTKKEKEKIEAKESILNKYTKKIEKIEKINKEYTDKQAILDCDSNKISDKIKLQYNQIEEYKINQANLINNIKEKKNEYSHKNNELENYIEVKTIQEKEYDKLNNDIDKINNNNYDLQQEIDEKKNILEMRKENYKKLGEEMKSLKEINLNYSGSIKNIEKDYSELEENINIIKKQINESELEYFQKNGNKLELEENKEKLKDELNSFYSIINELEENTSKMQIERNEIITLINKNKQIIIENNEKLKIINSENNRLQLYCEQQEISRNNLNKKISESENWKCIIKKQNQFSDFQNYILKNKLNNLENVNKVKLSSLLNKNREYEWYNKKLLTIDTDYEKSKIKLINMINSTETNNKSLLIQNESTRKCINLYHRKLNKCINKKATVQKQNNELKNELKIAHKNYTGCLLYLIILKQERKYLKKEIETLLIYNDNEKIKSKNEKIKLGELNEKINNLNIKKNEFKIEFETLTNTKKLLDNKINEDTDIIKKTRLKLKDIETDKNKLEIINIESKKSRNLIIKEEETLKTLKNNLLQNNESLSKLLLEIQEQILKIRKEKIQKENINNNLVKQIELYEYENEELEECIVNLDNSINKNKNYLTIIFNKNKELNTKLYTNDFKHETEKNAKKDMVKKLKIEESSKITGLEKKMPEKNIKDDKKVEEHDTLKCKFEEMQLIKQESENTIVQSIEQNSSNALIQSIGLKYRYEINPLINILTRTSNRPNYFSENRYTVMMQTYRNIRQIVSIDNKYSLNYTKANNIKSEDIVMVEKKARINNKHMPYNLYCNKMLEQVKSGWIMFMDDDDILYDEHVIETIIPYLKDEKNILIWRCLRGDKLYPGESFGNKIKKYDIGSNSFIFHSKYKHLAIWDDLEAADYRCIINLTKTKNLKIVWVNKIISKINNINPALGKGLMLDKPFKNLSQQNYLQLMYINKINSNLFPSLNLEYMEYTEKLGNKYIESYFDKIYILNLERRNDRWVKIKERLSKCGINNYIRYLAVDGKLKYFQDKYNNYLKLPFNEYDIKFKRKAIPSSGSYAILMSMYSLFTDAYKKKYNRILVLQDDIIMHKNFQYEFETKMQNIPNNWKLLYLGGNQREWNNIKTNKYYYIPNKTDGAFAVAYDKSIFKPMLKEIKLMKAPFDSGTLQTIQEKYNKDCYVLYPNLIIADLRDSDCRKGRNMIEWGKKLKWNLTDFDLNNSQVSTKLVDNKKNLLKPNVKINSEKNSLNENKQENLLKERSMNDMVSIIVTSYNCEKYIYHTLISLVSQSYKNIEILIIDDDSTDDTMNILRQFAKKDKRIKVIRNDKNYGTYISKNIGIKYAKGEFITFNDADDISISTRIEEQINFMKSNKKYSGCVCGFFSRSKKKLAMAEITLFVRKNIINEIGYFESVRVGADTEYRKRLEICGYKIHFLKKYLYSCLDRFIENSSGKETSLTREKRVGINSNIRNLYRKYFTYYHDLLKIDNSLKYMNFPLITRKYVVRYQNPEDKIYMEPKLTEIMRKHIESL
jgi:hypothetical protein